MSSDIVVSYRLSPKHLEKPTAAQASGCKTLASKQSSHKCAQPSLQALLAPTTRTNNAISVQCLTHPGTATGLENATVCRPAVAEPIVAPAFASTGGRVDTRTTAGQLDPGRYTVTAV